MASSAVPAPLPQSSNTLVCDVCDVVCDSQKNLDVHYDDWKHKCRSYNLARCLFGYVPHSKSRITCLDDLFNNPEKKGTLIGMQYLKNCSRGEKMVFACGLCDIACTTMFQHVDSIKHKRNYINKHFQVIFKDYKSFSLQVMETIAVVIEQVEGLQKFKEAIKNPTKSSSASDGSFRQTLDKVVEQLQIRGINCENPYKHPNERENPIALKSPVPSKQSAAAENASRKGIVEKRQNHGIDCKGNYRKEKVVPCQQAGSHASGTKEKTNINTIILPKSSADSKMTFKQMDDKTDKRQNHEFDGKDTCRKENATPSLQTRPRASAVNENPFKRPSQFKTLESLKRRKSELVSQYAGKPIISLSRPVPAPFSFSDQSVGVMVGNNMQGYNTQQVAKLPTTSYVPPVYEGLASKPIPSLWSSHSGSYQTTRPRAGGYFPPLPPAVSFFQSAAQGYGYYSDPSLRGFTNESAYGQASSVSDVGKAYAFEDNTWRRETGHPGAQHLHTSGTMSGSVSSLTGPTNSVASLKQGASSSSGYISDSKELVSKSSPPSQAISILHKEPSLPKSHGDSPRSEGLPPTSTSSRAQTSQSAKSDKPVKAASMLSPHTLKILQGREPESVKNILKRLSEYCPELKEVNISLLVDVLFQTGALR